MARRWGGPARGNRLGPMSVRTSLGRQVFIVCDLCAALVVGDGQAQHERWHRSAASPSNDQTEPLATSGDTGGRRCGSAPRNGG
jgi:hypothetical protein